MNKRLMVLALLPMMLFGSNQAQALEKEERLWEDETIYQISVDRFFNGDSGNDFTVDVRKQDVYNGGDFKGIMDKLDYIKDMGFTVISLSPVFDNEENGYHGHWVTDFYNTEEHFGTIDEFKELVDQAHKRDLRVIVEFVVDEVGKTHEWVSDPAKEDWFTEKPKLNLDHPELKDYLLESAQWWIAETDIDGYQVSGISSIPAAFWQAFNDAVYDVKDDFMVIGKDDNRAADDNLSNYDNLGFTSIADTAGTDMYRSAFSDFSTDLEPAIRRLEEQASQVELNRQVNILDDASMSRFTREMDFSTQNPGTRWKQALTFLYTIPGIPSVFYGSEIAIDGGEAPDNQQLMGFKADRELIDYITTIGRLRQELPALTRGDFEVLYANDGVLAFKREYKSEVIITAINDTSSTQKITLTAEQLDDNKELRGLLAGDLVREKDGNYQIVIDREESEIYALAEKTGIKVGYLAAVAAVWILFAIFILLVMKRSKRQSVE
ncbi:MAG: alpha-amylase family glycosyl hydrolase [Bacillus sp. (in: firmicutes)]